MNKENTEKLFKEFPEFFKHKEDLMSSLMAFGFECDDGWYNLIYNLCKDIKHYYDTHESNIIDKEWKIVGQKKGVPEHFYVTQVKEKFGSLRFYITGAPQQIHDMIHKAENKSYYICEGCGEKGEYYYRDELPWIQTLCDTCLDKYYMKMWSRIRDKKEDFISEWQRENKAPYKEGL